MVSPPTETPLPPAVAPKPPSTTSMVPVETTDAIVKLAVAISPDEIVFVLKPATTQVVEPAPELHVTDLPAAAAAAPAETLTADISRAEYPRLNCKPTSELGEVVLSVTLRLTVCPGEAVPDESESLVSARTGCSTQTQPTNAMRSGRIGLTPYTRTRMFRTHTVACEQRMPLDRRLANSSCAADQGAQRG